MISRRRIQGFLVNTLMEMLSLFIIFFSSLCSCGSQTEVAVQLKIKQGTLEGVQSVSRNGTRYYSFYSIPFAKPPIGELRFEPPQEAESWEGVRDAKELPPICIQPTWPNLLYGSDYMFAGQEDCLYLNVFTPTTNSSSQLPVLVHIHGGAFYTGNSHWFGPEYFMDHPIVVVTISYRLGIFGFLSAADQVLTGNYGLKDQRMAFKWIQENIDTFGGNPKSVTISGESCGGVSVHLHLYSPLSAGLFHRAISQSGTGLGLLAITKSETARRRAQALGVLSGCAVLETKELVKCLRTIPAEQLIASFKKFFIYDLIPFVSFAPVIESMNAKDAFLVEDPWKQDPINSVPWIVGVTQDDGSMMASRIIALPTLMNEWSSQYRRLFPLAFNYFDTTDMKSVSTITASIKKFYFGDKKISLKLEKNLTNMCTDGLFASDAVEAARRHNNKVFFYLYGHQNKHSFEQFIARNATRRAVVHHGDELISLSVLPIIPRVTVGPDLAVSERVVKYWVNFAEKGYILLSVQSEPNDQQMFWQPFAAPNFKYLHIQTISDVMDEKLFEERYKFWNSIISLRASSV